MKSMAEALKMDRPWLALPTRPAWDAEEETDEETEEDRLQRIEDARTDAAIDRLKGER